MARKYNWTILAACLFALAIAMVVFRQDEPQGTAYAASLPGCSAAAPEASADTAPAHRRATPQTTPATRAQEPPAFIPRNHPLPNQAAAGVSHEPLSHAELEHRAERVERDANHELARLIPLLGLAPDQQQRVFQALASTSPSFVPGMLVDGSAVKSPAANSQQTLLAELSAAQVAAYLQDSNESSAWWSEYLGNISSQLNNGTPAVGGSAAAVTTAPAADATTPAATTPATKVTHAITGDE
ncbi:MAG: hypothetical protein DVB26_07815 [Verrucomicrobia bacterium]|nr:MAG: hypothetical protein DVB26_07815 [Verrucomicrobiota bacterium]